MRKIIGQLRQRINDNTLRVNDEVTTHLESRTPQALAEVLNFLAVHDSRERVPGARL